MAVDDTFPPRNLPDGAVEWGRTLEDEVRSAQKDLLSLSQYTSGQNRSTAASLSDIARQLTAISEQQAILLDQQTRLSEIVAALPVPALNQDTTSGWSPGSSWATVASTSLAFPAGTTVGRFHAVGTANSNLTGGSGIPAGRCRVLIDGVAGVEMNFTGLVTGSTTVDARIAGTSQQSRTISGSGSVLAELQVQVTWLSGGLGSGSWSGDGQIVLNAQFTP